MIVRLGSGELTLADGGGKAANLARLIRAGYPVPPGFVVTTHAYRLFLERNALDRWVFETVAGGVSATPVALDAIAETIRARFVAGAIPAELAMSVREEYERIGSRSVAVRSSATTEDLPELSFAGQHDSFLNVVGIDALLRDVVRCWSSLWTARAIGYRIRNAVPHEDAALAVIVQAMVQSDAAGVLFTANPLTGRRAETVIDAALGLGEALVAGQVEPDHYVVDSTTGRILRKTIGEKRFSIRSVPGGGTTRAPESNDPLPAITSETIAALSALGQRVAKEFGTPQDIEWAVADGSIALLQARPITSLFPLPSAMPEEPLRVMLSLGAIQGMLDPFTPLGRDVFRNGAAVASTAIGARATATTQRAFVVAGERLFIDATIAARDPRLRRVLRKALSFVEPGIGRALDGVLEDPRLHTSSVRLRYRAARAVAPVLAAALTNATYALLWPDAARERIHRRIEVAIARLRKQGERARTLRERVDLCDCALRTVRQFGLVLSPGVAVGLGSLAVLHRLADRLPRGPERVLEATRGLPHNVTTEMDLALWDASSRIRGDVAAASYFASEEASVLANDAVAGTLPRAGQNAVDSFLARFGARGVAEIDVGRSRWREDPTLLMQSLQSYLQITDVERSPDKVFARGAASAMAAIASLAADVRREQGMVRAMLFRAAARRVRALAGLRESPKFGAIRLLEILRASFLAGGRVLAASGTLEDSSDIFFLSLEQLRAMERGEPQDWCRIVREQRECYDREKRRRQVPSLLLSDGRAFFGGAESTQSIDGEVISGTAVSAGVVEGLVRVIFDPHIESLAPGEILVCPGTDPAWTPLFLAAGGLVLEVGGLMSHGSVVAREYGIPAVVGVHGATTRLRNGQRVRVDGTHGTISVLSS
jgi:rifampicin phosphotransferase